MSSTGQVMGQDFGPPPNATSAGGGGGGAKRGFWASRAVFFGVDGSPRGVSKVVDP